MTDPSIRDHVAKLLDEAPPPTDQQRTQVRALLSTTTEQRGAA